MDPVVSAFMQRIVWSLTSALVWLMINAVAGLKFELAFFDGNHKAGTILFYCWLVVSIFILLPFVQTLVEGTPLALFDNSSR